MLSGPTKTTRTAPDGSEITTTTDASGSETEDKGIRKNQGVQSGVTTRDGRRTCAWYPPSGDKKEVNDV